MKDESAMQRLRDVFRSATVPAVVFAAFGAAIGGLAGAPLKESVELGCAFSALQCGSIGLMLALS
jgi:hypothetical protein